MLDAQVGRYGLPARPADLHAAVAEVDVGGTFRRGPAGAPVFAVGKHRGRSLAEVAAVAPDYLRWMLGQGFLDDALALVRGALWAAERASK